jgi:hypothetical protein
MKWNSANRFTCANIIKASLLLVGSICTALVVAQQQTYHCISYYKILPGKEQELRNMVKAVDVKVQQERVNRGAISGWYLFEVLNPSGSSAEYDYIVITSVNHFKSIYETPYSFDSALKKIIPGKDARFYSDYHTRLSGISRLVKEEIYAGIAAADSSIPGGFQFKYLVVDYMQPKPEKFGQYIKMETDTFRLVHKERIKLGALSQWACLQLYFPFDMKTGYNFLAMNFYKDIDMMFDSKYVEGIRNAFPSVSINDLFQSVGAMRDNPKADLWRLIVYAVPKKE